MATNGLLAGVSGILVCRLIDSVYIMW